MNKTFRLWLIIFSLVLGLTFSTIASTSERSIVESERDIPIVGSADVIVVGGTSAGVSAAVKAASQEASVMLIAERPYLGEDITGTYRLWLEKDEEPESQLAQAVFQESFVLPQGIDFTYEFDLAPSGGHLDNQEQPKLTDGLATKAADNSIQFNSDVSITLDLGEIKEFSCIELFAFQRLGNFEAKEMGVSISDDARRWTELGTAINKLAGTGDYEANGGVSIALNRSGKARYLKLTIKKSTNVKRMLLSEIIVHSMDATANAYRNPPTMMQVKQTLEQALLDSEVKFLYSSYLTDLLVDQAGNLSGVVIGNRAGRQAITGKVIIDATNHALVAKLAGVDFTSHQSGYETFTRVVVGDEIEIQSDPNIISTRIMPTRLPASGGNNQAVEYTLNIFMPDDSHASYANAEQIARNLTWDPYQVDTSEFLFHLPTRQMVAKSSHQDQWPGAAKVDLDVFKPAEIERLYVINGYADISRTAIDQLLRPLEYMEVGSRVGEEAGVLALKLSEPNNLMVLTDSVSQQAADGDVHELLIGIRPTQTGLPTVKAKEHALPVLGEYDVVVVGAGTAGAPAAIGAARQGAKTLVVEYLHGLGGMGTLGQVSTYFGGYTNGFTAEVDRETDALGGIETWNAKSWNVEAKMEWYRQAMLEANAEIWFNTMGIGAYVENNQVKGVVVATPHGRGIVLADVVVDSTGNSDIAIAAGAQYRYTDAEHVAMQGAAVVYRDLPPDTKYWFVNLDWMFVDETDLINVWHALIIGKERFIDHFDLGQLIQTRERRNIIGDYVISPLDILTGKKFYDTIAFAQSSIDSHGFYVHPIFTINPPEHRQYRSNVPYRALLPKDLDGILVTGLGISAHRDAIPALRMQPDVQNLGYAAGVAAAMVAEANTTTRGIDIRELQQHLIEKGNITHGAVVDADSPASNSDVVNYALDTFRINLRNLPIVLAAEEQIAMDLLQERYEELDNDRMRKDFAKVMGVLGDSTGIDALIDAVNSYAEWDQGWDYQVYGVYGKTRSELDSLIMALGLTGENKGLEAILNKLDLLDANSEFSHHRAVAVALEGIKDPSAAPALARLLSKPRMTGYSVQTLEDASELYFMGNITHTLRDYSLREIILAKALYCLGDYQGIGKSILENYAKDLRGLFSSHAIAVLNEPNSLVFVK